MKKRYLPRGNPVFCLVLAIGVLLATGGGVNAQSASDKSEWPKTDFDNMLIDFSEIMSGGPPKDGIPPVDKPEFDDIAAAAEWIDPREPVIVVRVADEARAYPIQVLTWHEIVNDQIGDTPLSVTFCPLCNASIVFERRMGDQVLDFGTTGRLRKSDLVMYDRQTESWWQQFSGQAIIGDMAGKVLTQYPSSVVAFEDFRESYPDAKVLSKRTGHTRAYGNNPYRGYDSIDDQPFLFNDPVDERLPPMERVLNISIDDIHKVYPLSKIADTPVLNDTVANAPIVVFTRKGVLSALDASAIKDSRTVPSAIAYSRTIDDRVLEFDIQDNVIIDLQTKSRWNRFGQATEGELVGKQLVPLTGGVHFAFAWLAFNPDSQIFGD